MDVQAIVSLVSNILLVLLLFVALISSLIGLKRGFFRSLVSLIVWGLGLTVVFGFNMFFTELYFQIDLSFLKDYFGNFVVTINKTEVTIFQSLGGIISDVLTIFGLGTAASAVKALAMSFLSLFVLAFHIVIICILCPIVSLIFNMTITKLCIEKFVKKKLRLAGFFVNGLKMATISVFLLTPAFNLLENVANSFNVGLKDDYEFNEEESNIAWRYAYPVLQGYNESFLHKFFSVITGHGTYNAFYTATVDGENGTKVNFMELIDGVSSVAVATLSTMEEFSEASITTAVLADHTLEVITTEVLSSAFLMSEVLPIAITIGVETLINMEDPIISKEDGLLLETEIGHLDFSKDLSSYVELFRILNKEDMITDAIMESGTFDYELSRENQVVVKEALNAFKTAQESIKEDTSKTTILDVILPPVLSSLVANYSSEEMPLNNILPSDPEEYRELDLIELLQVSTDILFNVNDLYINTVSNNPELNVLNRNNIKKQTNEVENLSFRTISKLMENNSFVRALLDKENVFNGVPDSRDENGEKTIKTIDLFVGNESDKGLLDFSFLVKTFPELIDFALNSVVAKNSELGISEDLLNEINNLVSTYVTKEQWASEIDALLKCVGTIFNNEDLPILMLDENGEFISSGITIDIASAGTQAVVKELCDYIDLSNIIVKLFPSILKSTVDFSTIPMLSQFNISADDLNFEFTEGSTLGSEIKDLIDAVSYIIDIDFSGNILTSESLEASDLYHAFEYMVDCQIINPEADENGSYSHNMMRKIILGLMNSQEIKDFGLYLDEELYDEKLRNGGLLEELSNICDILDTVKSSESLKNIINSSESISITDLEGQDVENLIVSISKSDFLRPCLSSVLEKQISPAFEGMGINPKYFNFDAMENATSDVYADEGHKLNVIIEELKVIVGDDISSVDWINLISDDSKRTNIKNLFTNLQSLHFLDGEFYEENDINKENPYDRFGLIIYSFLEGSITDYINEDNKLQIKKDFSFVYYDEYFASVNNGSKSSTLTRNELWEKEIDILLDVLSNVQPLLNQEEGSSVIKITIDASNIDNISKLIVGESDVRGINDLTIFRSVLTAILDKTLGDGSALQIEGFDLSSAYMHTDIFKVGYELNFQSGAKFNQFALDNIVVGDSLTTRDAEIELRKKEISKLLNITKDILNLGEFSLDTISNWVNDNFIGELLTDIHDSYIMHSPSVALSKNKITIFEKIIDVVLENSVSSLIYESAEQRLEVIQKITESEINSGELSWIDPINGEIVKLSSALEDINGLKTSTGDDTPLKKFLLGASDAPTTIDISVVNEDAEHREIEILINALSSSMLINPDERISIIYKNNSLLGKLFDDNIGTALSDIGMTNHSFRKSDLFENNWSNEAIALSNLVNEFKKLDDSGNLASINWADIDASILKSLFNSLYKVPSISATYGTIVDDFDGKTYGKSSFEDLIYYVVDMSFNVDISGDGVKDTFDESSINDIKIDIYSISDSYAWFTADELNGISSEEKGEVNKFIDLLESASGEGYGIIKDGTFVLDNFTKYSNNKNGYGVEILKELNEIHFLRTVFGSVFENSFASNSGFQVGSLSTEKIYGALFNDVLNYKSTNGASLNINNRDREVSERLNEIENIVDTVVYSEEINELLNGEGVSLDSFTSEDIENVFNMLRSLENSRLFHKGRYKVGGTYNTTFFEDTMILVLQQEGIEEQMYDSLRDTKYSSKEEKTASLVKDITFGNVFHKDLDGDGVFDDNEKLTWEYELNELENGLKNILSVDGFINQEGGIDLAKLNRDEIILVLDNLNGSYLAHDTIGKMIKNVFINGIHVTQFQIDSKELDKSPDYYLDNISGITFQDSIDKWESEIINIGDFKAAIGESINDINFALQGTNIVDILSVAGKSKVVRPMLSDFIYSILKDAGLSEYISIISNSGNSSYSSYFGNYEDSDSYKVAKSRRDTIDYLIKEKIVSWEDEGKVLDNIIHNMNSLSSLNINDASSELADSVSSLFGLSYTYLGEKYNYAYTADSDENAAAISDMVDMSKYHRGYLASELMLNFLDEKLNTSEFNVKYFEEVRYDYSYVCFNDYEKEALKTIINLAASLKGCSSLMELVSTDFSGAKNMGPGSTINSAKRDENNILLKDGWNSNIAIELIASNYLERLLNASLGTSFVDVFKVENKPIEYAANNEWANNIMTALGL